ncbi:phage tail tube protein [Blastopirellula sp. J2-11]|uniref:phage tail tube protein n=1 Tax=Blastopirellula sp. J2-11 TaxID=2943192 RepID=UPI0021C580C2|nr:phage tail tube protein [Blastopirellula sp. J2-11]UUO04626.1 phage tail tube protein [Blastopirellula sp. J2-11]
MVTTVSGFQTQFGLGVQHASNLATRQFEHFGCNLDKQESIIVADGMLGKRSPLGDSAQLGTYTVGGTVTLQPRPDDLTFLLPYILGAAADDDTFALADSLPELVACVDREIKVQTYRGLKVNQATFRSATGGNLELELDLQGKLADADANSGTFPDIASTLSAKLPFIHHQGSITVDGAAIAIDNSVITINNALELTQFNNSQTRTVLPEGARVVTWAFDTELGDDELAHLIANAARGVTGSISYANGVDTLTLTFGLLQKPRTPIPIQGKGTIRPSHQFTAYEDLANSAPQLVATCTDETE